MLAFLLFNFITIGLTTGTRLGYPDYTSAWTLLSAQSGDGAQASMDHGLGEVPAMVEVLVTPVDGPYKGFLFKAMGTGNKEDDTSLPYGGVVYVYNDVSVVVMVPNRHNGYDVGYAIYTGDSAYWTGGSSYTSREAYVKVRCWLLSNMPTPCYQADNIQVEAGAASYEPTFIELNHGTGQLPELVLVRTYMMNGVYDGWYTDSIGTTRYISTYIYERYGGIKFGYDAQTIRIWIPSTDGLGGSIFNVDDGWGLRIDGERPTVGVLDVRVWCDLGLEIYAQNSVNLGPNVANEQFALTINTLTNTPSSVDVFASVMVETLGGQNDGYFFNGIDGATVQGAIEATPCAYGGFIYSYNTQTINLRRPSQNQGAIVCIADTNGNGMYTGATQNGVVHVKMWNLVLEYPAGRLSSKRYKRYRDAKMDYPDIGTVRMTTNKECLNECTRRTLCMAVEYNHSETSCTMYDFFSTANVEAEIGCDVWQVTG